MLGIGITELMVVVVVMLVVVGPERLPRLMRTAGRYYGQLRRAADELRRAFVLEADRMDAEERYEQLKERRQKAAEARRRAAEAAGPGTVGQQAKLVPPDEDAPVVHDDPVDEPTDAEPTDTETEPAARVEEVGS